MLTDDHDYENFLEWLEGLLPSPNMFCALRIDRAFSYIKTRSVPGMHLHFLSADQQHGGYLPDCRPHQAKVCVQLLSRMELGLPLSQAYQQWNFHRDISQDLDKAEK